MFFKRRKKEATAELEEFLEGYELPTFPGIIIEVLSLLRDDNASMKDIGDLLKRDPGMHVKILRTVNSAAYGLSSKISNLYYALNLLGKSRVESLLLSHAVKDRLPEIQLINLDIKQFWFTASLRASLAKVLADKLHPNTKNEAFTAGLLQDMAIPVLAFVKQEQYDSLLEVWFNHSGKCLTLLEKEAFGYDHQQIGKLMAEKWDFPDYLIHAITHHHEYNGSPKVDPSVWLASFIKSGKGNDEFETLMTKSQEHFQLEPEQTENFLFTASSEAEKFFIALN